MRDKALPDDKWFSVDVCRAWLTGVNPISSSADTRHGSTDPVGLNNGVVLGLNSSNQNSGDEFLRHRASLTCASAKESASYISDNIGFIPSLPEVTNATAAFSAADNICTYSGDRYFNRFLYALITMLTAFAYLFTLAGLAAGTALAQILLGLIFMMLPVILVVAAIPVQAARKFLPRILKTTIAAFLAHTIFLVILSFIVFVIDVVSFAILNATDPGTSVRVIALALIPYIAKKVVSGVTKQLGFDFSSMKGALKVTSGIAAGATGGGGGGQRGGIAQRYARRMGHSMVSPYRMRSALGMGGRGMRTTPSAALAGGAGGAATAAALTGTTRPRVGREPWGGPSLPGAPGTTNRQGGKGQRGAPGSDGTPGGTGADRPPGADGQTGAPGADGAPGRAVRTGPAASSADRTSAHKRPPSGPSPASTPPRGVILPGNPDLSGYDPRLQRDSSTVLEQPTDVSAGGIHVPQGATLPPPPAEEPLPSQPVSPPDATDYDSDRYQGRVAETARLGGHAALWGAGFARRHALLTYAATGLAVTGVGIPAAVAVYAGGKMMKKVARRPTQAVVGKAKQGVTSGIQRWQDIRAEQSQAQLRFRQIADRGTRMMPGASQ